MLFFSKNRFFSLLVFIVSFFIPQVGLAGLLSVFFALMSGRLLGFDNTQIETGIFSYSAILFGLGFASNYEMGTAFILLLIIGAVLTMLFSVALTSRLQAKNIPGLSLAFIFTTWIVILASKQFAGLGLSQRHIYWVNETYAIGGTELVSFVQKIENWEIAPYISGFFRSMSAIIFQGNIAAGILLSFGLLIHSRISFLLTIIGYSVAILFNQLMGGFNSGDLSYYNMGTNFMLVSIALGGFYLIPSIRSILWTFITIPIAYILVVSIGTITFNYGLPVFSLPFCLVVILFLYCLQLRKSPGKLITVPIHYYSPEENLYRFLNGKERLMNRYYHPFILPVMGEWMISQGYDGNMTHKADWSKAIDFVILDSEMKTFQLPANQPEHFYAYNKPVLCPADGIIEEVVDGIEDNEIGKNNTAQNWGNTIIIKHTNGLYSKLSHLKKNSFKVSKGAYVKKGDLIAACGNSGRSPEPHLHFQVQKTPYIGSKTIPYPFSYYYSRKSDDRSLMSFTVPEEGSFVCNVIPNTQLQDALNFQPGATFEVIADNGQIENWEVFTDIYNESYIYCNKHKAYAYFINNGTAFYFSDYVGTKKSLLFHFYISAYKIILSTEIDLQTKDIYPLSIIGYHPIRWIQDLIAPFYIFNKIEYKSKIHQNNSFLASNRIEITSERTQKFGWYNKKISSSSLIIENKTIQSFSIESNHKIIRVVCKKIN